MALHRNICYVGTLGAIFRRSLPFVFLIACAAEPPTQPPTQIEMQQTPPALDREVTAVSSTLPADGNRFAAGQGKLTELEPLDIELDGVPEWLTAVPHQNGILWVALLEDGQAQAFHVVDGSATSAAITPSVLPAGMPPLLAVVDGTPQLVLPSGDYSPLTNPVLFNSGRDLAYIDTSGNLIIEQGDTVTTLPINAQPDARILHDEQGRLLINSDPTDQYAHGIMGDRLEAKTLTLVATQPEPSVIRKIPITDGWVMESIAPIWADFDGDGNREIVVTRANAAQGAQIVLLDELGNLLAEGPAIGNGNRWRHQLALAPFAPDGMLELVEVRTPHIGGPTRFYQWEGGDLTAVTHTTGYTSHPIGSRNLDMAVAGHFDSSGNITLIVPTQVRDALGGIQHTANGAEVVWQLPLTGWLMTNIAAPALPDGTLALGVGLDNETLRIWQP